MLQPQAPQPRQGQDHRVQVTGGIGPARRHRLIGPDADHLQAPYPRQTRGHVTAQVHHLQVGAGGQQLGGPARRAGAHAGSLRQVGQGQAVAGAQGVARVLARRHADDLQTLDRLRGQVLEGVDHQVHLAIQERVAQPGREDPHPTELSQGSAVAVAVRAHGDQVDAQAAGTLAGLAGRGGRTAPAGGHQRVSDLPGLGQRQARAARAQAKPPGVSPRRGHASPPRARFSIIAFVP